MNLGTALTLAAKKKKMAKDAKDSAVIKKEEEITKRGVKTIMDEEAAELEREALKTERSFQVNFLNCFPVFLTLLLHT